MGERLPIRRAAPGCRATRYARRVKLRRHALAFLLVLACNAKPPPPEPASPAPPVPVIEMELMTSDEIGRAIRVDHKTTALVFAGGTEQRGPHCVTGGHTLMARATVRAIALGLGDALAAPVLPYSITDVDPKLPGSMSVSSATFTAVHEELVRSLVQSGFHTVVLMGDHSGGQTELADVAQKLDHALGSARVFYAGDVYERANREFDEWLAAEGLPPSQHGGIPDTSEMMYLGGDAWVRRDKLPIGTKDNGVIGDARPSTPAIGKRLFDLKVKLAIDQIRSFPR